MHAFASAGTAEFKRAAASRELALYSIPILYNNNNARLVSPCAALRSSRASVVLGQHYSVFASPPLPLPRHGGVSQVRRDGVRRRPRGGAWRCALRLARPLAQACGADAAAPTCAPGEWHKACLACAQCGCKLNPAVPGLLQERDGVPYCKKCAASPTAAQPKASPPPAPAPAAPTPVWAAAMEAGGIGKPVAPSAEIDDDDEEAPPHAPPPVPAPAPAPAPASPPAPKPASPPPAAPPPTHSAVASEPPQAAKALAGATRCIAALERAGAHAQPRRVTAKFQALQGPTPPAPGSARDIAGACFFRGASVSCRVLPAALTRGLPQPNSAPWRLPPRLRPRPSLSRLPLLLPLPARAAPSLCTRRSRRAAPAATGTAAACGARCATARSRPATGLTTRACRTAARASTKRTGPRACAAAPAAASCTPADAAPVRTYTQTCGTCRADVVVPSRCVCAQRVPSSRVAPP